jgi:hypothetical protein
LQNRYQIWSSHCNESDKSEDSSGDRYDLDVVDRPDDWGLGYVVGKLTRKPGMHLFCGDGAGRKLETAFHYPADIGLLLPSDEVVSRRLAVKLRMRSNGRMEDEEDRSGLQHQL